MEKPTNTMVVGREGCDEFPQQFAQDNNMIGKRQRNSPTAFWFAAVERRAYSTVRQSRQDRLEMPVV
jgi:hypothetical protein